MIHEKVAMAHDKKIFRINIITGKHMREALIHSTI